MKNNDYCFKNCPYLIALHEGEKLPFYCELFHTFLTTKKNRIIRAEGCSGKRLNPQEAGYQLISSYQNHNINKQATKWGFHRLNGQIQTQFVQLVQLQGTEIGIHKDIPFKERLIIATLIGQIKTVNNQLEEESSFKLDEFGSLLNKLSEDYPTLLNDQSKNILNNLFAVLDNSEQEMLSDILSTPEMVESFLKSVNEIAQGDNLLKDFRRLLDEVSVQLNEVRRHLLKNFEFGYNEPAQTKVVSEKRIKRPKLPKRKIKAKKSPKTEKLDKDLLMMMLQEKENERK